MLQGYVSANGASWSTRQVRSTLFGLYVDGLEKPLLETADIDAPTLMGVMVPLLLDADDLSLMSESGFKTLKQLDA